MISYLNLLNLVSVILSFVLQVFVVRTFGAGLQTDVYYLSIRIIQFMQVALLGFVTELFVPAYSEIKMKDANQTKNFVGAVFYLVLFFSLGLWMFAFLGSSATVKLFASGFSSDKLRFASEFMKIMSIAIPFSFLGSLCGLVLNTHFFLHLTCFVSLLPPVASLLALLLFTGKYGMLSLAYAYVLSAVLSFVIVFIASRRFVGLKWLNPFTNSDLLYLLRKSSQMKLSNMVYILKEPISTNILSNLPLGCITLYSYADRVLKILFSVTSSPILNLFYVRTSDCLANNRRDELKILLITVLRSNLTFMLMLLMPAIVFFKPVMHLLLMDRVPSDQMSLMYAVFVSLSPVYLLQAFEMPFAHLTQAMKQSWKIFVFNVQNILIYSVIVFIGVRFIGIFALPFGIFVAQLSNTYGYFQFVRREIKTDYFTSMIGLLKCSICVACGGVLNVFLPDTWYLHFISSGLMICLGLFCLRKDILLAFNLLAQRIKSDPKDFKDRNILILNEIQEKSL